MTFKYINLSLKIQEVPSSDPYAHRRSSCPLRSLSLSKGRHARQRPDIPSHFLTHVVDLERHMGRFAHMNGTCGSSRAPHGPTIERRWLSKQENGHLMLAGTPVVALKAG